MRMAQLSRLELINAGKGLLAYAWLDPPLDKCIMQMILSCKITMAGSNFFAARPINPRTSEIETVEWFVQ